MSHTKGPWKYDEQPVKAHGFYITSVDQSHTNTFIGEVGGGLQSHEEIKKNAQLIAKAPELLEALKELLHEYTTTDFDFVGLDPKLIEKCNRLIYEI